MDLATAIRKLEQFKRELPILVGNEMVNHAQDNIRAGGYDGGKYTPRAAGTARDIGRNVLIDTGDGMRSITFKHSGKLVWLEAEAHMVAHNEGAHIKGTFAISAHNRTRKGRPERVRAHPRKVDSKLPVRQITGNSPVLKNRIKNVILTRLKMVLNR